MYGTAERPGLPATTPVTTYHLHSRAPKVCGAMLRKPFSISAPSKATACPTILHPPNFGRVEVWTRSAPYLGEGLPTRPSRAPFHSHRISFVSFVSFVVRETARAGSNHEQHQWFTLNFGSLACATILHPPNFGSLACPTILHPPNFGRVEVWTRSAPYLGEGLPTRPSRAPFHSHRISFVSFVQFVVPSPSKNSGRVEF